MLGIVPRHELCGAHVELSVARSGRWLGVVSHVVGDGDGAGVAVVRFEDGDVLEFDLATVQCGRLSDKPPLGMQEVRELCARVCMVCGERGSYQACCSAVMCEECRRKLWQNQRDVVGEVRSATPRARRRALSARGLRARSMVSRRVRREARHRRSAGERRARH